MPLRTQLRVSVIGLQEEVGIEKNKTKAKTNVNVKKAKQMKKRTKRLKI